MSLGQASSSRELYALSSNDTNEIKIIKAKPSIVSGKKYSPSGLKK